MKFITITSKKLQTLNQYYFDRSDMCEYFEIYAPFPSVLVHIKGLFNGTKNSRRFN